jgi:hypothetical protein
MRFIFLLGGFIGFSLVALTGWLADRALDNVLRDASLGALGCAFLFRWFWNLYAGAIAHTVQQKRAAAEAAAEKEAAATKAGSLGAAKAR